MAVTVKPANPEQALARRNTLFQGYVGKVFAAMQKDGKTPVDLRGPLGPRSEILLGLKRVGESTAETQDRIIASFALHYPLIAKSGAVTS